MIKNIIFDFDGVLVDSEILVAKAFTRYFNEIGHQYSESFFLKFAGKKTNQVISDLCKEFSIKNEEDFYYKIMNLTSKIYSEELITVKGAFDYVKKSKRNLFIGSNSVKKRIIEGLNKVGLNKYFDDKNIFSFDMVSNPKPHPDIYLKVINDRHLMKNETIIIEDSSVGTKAGFLAGVKVIGLTAGGHWDLNRSTKELAESGAFEIIDDYKFLDDILNDL